MACAVTSGEETEGTAELGGQTGRAASGVCEPAAVRVSMARVTAAARRVGRAQLRALLRDGRNAACHLRGQEKHLEAATDPRGRVQSKPDPAPAAGRGHAAGVEERFGRLV